MKESLDNLSVELKVFAVLSDPDTIWMQGDLEILINGERPYKDGEIIDSYILQESLMKDGEHFIFSCCCGIPECSGWIKGIKVTHLQNIVKWEDLNNDRTWYLEKNKIEQDLKDINEEVQLFKKYFANKEIEYVGFGYNL